MKKIVLFFLLFITFFNVDADEFKIRYLSVYESDTITINVDNDDYQITSLENGKIEIKDFEVYKSFLQSNNPEEYPLYIVKLDDGYYFSDYKNHLGENYILSNKIFTIGTSDLSANINTCDSLLGYQFVNLLKNNIFKIIYIAIPIILIVYSTYDFAFLTLFENKDGVPGALKKFGRRIIASFMIFIIPNVLIFLTNILASPEVESCINTFKTTENIKETD